MSLKDPIECVLKHMGEWPYRSCRNSDWQCEDVSGNREVENVVVAYCYSALFIYSYFYNFNSCNLNVTLAYTSRVKFLLVISHQRHSARGDIG